MRPIRIRERLCNEYRAAGLEIEYRHRTNRHGYKAGALQEGLETATGEFIAIFDADFIPPADFLNAHDAFLYRPRVGVVQTRWGYLNNESRFLRKSRRCCSTAISFWSMARAAARDCFLISMARRVFCAAG